eukprot:gb/GECH01010610.1/.p1 GENE.gb/GECH01010610.1/~~gb/GECH01010610.1/.p1  ORF type:complete len:210 (+),score=41.25 gb/GECH01010610.1/:1-630(+)
MLWSLTFLMVYHHSSIPSNTGPVSSTIPQFDTSRFDSIPIFIVAPEHRPTLRSHALRGITRLAQQYRHFQLQLYLADGRHSSRNHVTRLRNDIRAAAHDLVQDMKLRASLKEARDRINALLETKLCVAKEVIEAEFSSSSSSSSVTSSSYGEEDGISSDVLEYLYDIRDIIVVTVGQIDRDDLQCYASYLDSYAANSISTIFKTHTFRL